MGSVVVTFCCAAHPRSRANASNNSRVQILFMLNFNRLGRTLQRVFENVRKCRDARKCRNTSKIVCTK